MIVIEEIIDRIARSLGLPPEVVRERNLYHGTGEDQTMTHYLEEIGDNRIQTLWAMAREKSDFSNRRREIAAWNDNSIPGVKRGLAITPRSSSGFHCSP